MAGNLILQNVRETLLLVSVKMPDAICRKPRLCQFEKVGQTRSYGGIRGQFPTNFLCSQCPQILFCPESFVLNI